MYIIFLAYWTFKGGMYFCYSCTKKSIMWEHKYIYNMFDFFLCSHILLSILGFPAGLSHPGKFWGGPGQDGTGQDLDTLKVQGPISPGTKQVQKSQDIFKVPGLPGPFFQVQKCNFISFSSKILTILVNIL